MYRNISQNRQEIVNFECLCKTCAWQLLRIKYRTGVSCDKRARAETFKFDQFVSMLCVRFLASVFFSFSRILEVFVFEFVF